jgi:hypothetical protein
VRQQFRFQGRKVVSSLPIYHTSVRVKIRLGLERRKVGGQLKSNGINLKHPEVPVPSSSAAQSEGLSVGDSSYRYAGIFGW